MGWDSGADLVWSCWGVASRFIPPERLQEAARAFYTAAKGDFDLADGAPKDDMLGRVAKHYHYVRDGAPETAEEGAVFILYPGQWEQRLVFRDGLWKKEA